MIQTFFRRRSPGSGRLAVWLTWFAAAVTCLCAQTPSKEYIRLGGRVIAIENLTITIAPQSLLSGNVGIPYSAPLTASGGTAPYSWTCSCSSLQFSGLSFENGTISGTPAGAGTYNITVTAKDSGTPQATGSVLLSITVNAASGLVIGPQALPRAATGTAYPATALTASGGTAPYSWTLTAGSLPPGLALSNGTISGTPTASAVGGTYPIVVQVTDSGQPQHTASISLSIPVLAVTTTSLPGGVVNVGYNSGDINVVGGSGTYSFSWTLLSGALPAGLSISTSGRSIDGKPSVGGTATHQVQVTDTQSQLAVTSSSLSITIVEQISPLQITSASALPTASQNTGYSTTLTASGGSPPYTWTVTGLPAGLACSTSGTISGTTSAVGSFPLTVRVDGVSGPPVIRTDFELTVVAALTIPVHSDPFPSDTLPFIRSCTQPAARIHTSGRQAVYLHGLTLREAGYSRFR